MSRRRSRGCCTCGFRHDRDRWQRGEDGVGVGAPLLRPVKHERSPDRLDDAREHAKKVDYDAGDVVFAFVATVTVVAVMMPDRYLKVVVMVRIMLSVVFRTGSVTPLDCCRFFYMITVPVFFDMITVPVFFT